MGIRNLPFLAVLGCESTSGEMFCVRLSGAFQGVWRKEKGVLNRQQEQHRCQSVVGNRRTHSYQRAATPGPSHPLITRLSWICLSLKLLPARTRRPPNCHRCYGNPKSHHRTGAALDVKRRVSSCAHTYLGKKMALWRKFSNFLKPKRSSFSRSFTSGALGQLQHWSLPSPARSDLVGLVLSSGSISPVADIRIGIFSSDSRENSRVQECASCFCTSAAASNTGCLDSLPEKSRFAI